MSQRRAEFGVRLALGAQPGDVVRVGLRQSLVMVVSGVAAGALLAVPVRSGTRVDPVTALRGDSIRTGRRAVAGWSRRGGPLAQPRTRAR